MHEIRKEVFVLFNESKQQTVVKETKYIVLHIFPPPEDTPLQLENSPSSEEEQSASWGFFFSRLSSSVSFSSPARITIKFLFSTTEREELLNDVNMVVLAEEPSSSPSSKIPSFCFILDPHVIVSLYVVLDSGKDSTTKLE
ncbi:putative condensin complex subunit 2 isoform X1 [Sesbania bispinosa]|nr:putative condensin complex subunit 2 isoform X1 [Sesbania bispinosa]